MRESASTARRERGVRCRGASGHAPFAPANLHVRDLCPHSLQIEHLCGLFLRESPWPWWPCALSRCGLPWLLDEWLLLLLLLRKGLVFMGRMSYPASKGVDQGRDTASAPEGGWHGMVRFARRFFGGGRSLTGGEVHGGDGAAHVVHGLGVIGLDEAARAAPLARAARAVLPVAGGTGRHAIGRHDRGHLCATGTGKGGMG